MKKHCGFTLLELMATLAIAAILMYFSSSFTGVLKNNKISTSVQDFVAAVNLARNEAISRATRITFCKSDPSSNPRSCINDTSVNNWEKGWIVFVDVNNDQQYDSSNTANLLRVYDSLSYNIELNGDATSQDFISFDGRGFRVNAAGNILTNNTVFQLCDERTEGNTSREITINRVGHVSTERKSRANVCGA